MIRRHSSFSVSNFSKVSSPSFFLFPIAANSSSSLFSSSRKCSAFTTASPIQVNAMAMMNQGEKAFVPFQYELSADLPAGMVDLEVHYCGFCHSDVSHAVNEWGMTQYPFVGGHEIIAKVLRSNDPNVQVGQMVGVGYSRGKYCRVCRCCANGDVQMCPTQENTIVHNHGGFASHCRVYGDAVVPIPASVNLATAGPLLCAGLTLYTCLAFVKPSSRVGVIGIGGLGSLGLQLLSKTGATVVAFTSRPEEKAEELKKFGATEIIDSRNRKAIRHSDCDLIISTVNVALDWETYVKGLAPRGRLHFVGAVLEPLKVTVFPLMDGYKCISSSAIGSISDAKDLLEFCGRHKIEPQVEMFPLEKINDAYKKIVDGTIRYRAVLQVKK